MHARFRSLRSIVGALQSNYNCNHKPAIIYYNKQQFFSDMAAKERHLNNNNNNNNAIQSRELRFALPYGELAAQEWGDTSGHPVLAVHGWLDNSGSFDPIIPYILKPHNLHIVAIDEPGVGLSSHKPPGSDYSRWSTLIEMKRVIDKLNWSKCTILGHSQGGAYALLFAAIYPNIVERVVCVDIFKPLAFNFENWSKRVVRIIDAHMKYESSGGNVDPALNPQIPIYTEAEALKRMMEAHANSLNEQTARVLMKRGAKQQSNGVTFTRDIRLKLPSLDPPPIDEQMLKFMESIRSDLLIIRAKQTPYQYPDHIRERYYEVYERNCRLFKDVYMDGSHHLHMNNPETVGPVINEFLNESFALTVKSNL